MIAYINVTVTNSPDPIVTLTRGTSKNSRSSNSLNINPIQNIVSGIDFFMEKHA